MSGAPDRWARSRKRLSKDQIHATTDQQVAALEKAGHDPYAYAWQRQPDGNVARTRSTTTFEPTDGDESSQCRDLKRWRCLSAVESKALHRLAPEVHYHCQDLPNLWWGDVNGGAPCPVAQVGERGQEILESLRRHFENSSHRVELIISVLHNDKIGGYDADGKALINVHAHFLFTCLEKGERLRNFRRKFRRKFPIGGDMEPVQDTHRAISYILGTPDRQPLVDSGDYVAWCEATKGRRRTCCHGRFKRARAGWKNKRLASERNSFRREDGSGYDERYSLKSQGPKAQRTASSGAPKIVEPNTVVGETMVRRRGSWVGANVIKNAQSA
ncbi:MAG: hypothetical protein H0T83_04890 [Chthoniobacterales bacterium]|nr:hypothetical protein [Chthoniobacterales bacterium]